MIKKFWLGWHIAFGSTLLVLALASLPPFVGPEARMFVMQVFASFCHQLPEYSPHWNGVQLAVGHRMYGVFWGLMLGTAAFHALRRWDAVLNRNAGSLLVLSGLPMALDWTLDALDLWSKTPTSRFATGILFGLAAGYFLARAFVRLLAGDAKVAPR